MPKDFAIVLNNGSLNSAVVTAMASQRFRPIMIFADMTSGAAAGSGGLRSAGGAFQAVPGIFGSDRARRIGGAGERGDGCGDRSADGGEHRAAAHGAFAGAVAGGEVGVDA